jgi:hypothetical protein
MEMITTTNHQMEVMNHHLETIMEIMVIMNHHHQAMTTTLLHQICLQEHQGQNLRGNVEDKNDISSISSTSSMSEEDEH